MAGHTIARQLFTQVIQHYRQSVAITVDSQCLGLSRIVADGFIVCCGIVMPTLVN